MKKIFCLAFLSLNMIASAQGAISLPDLSIMYTFWQNKVVFGATGMKSCSISVAGGTVTPASWTDQNGLDREGYYVNVAEGTERVSITLMGKDFKGKRHNLGTHMYKVVPFPTAQVSGSTISKSTGFVANVSLGADSPFTGINFQVEGGTIDGVPFSGKLVPGSLFENVATGKKVAVEMFYTQNGVKSAVPAQGILVVTD
ncbi:MAG: hypothetical protein NT109_08940 [Flavobacteriia bacterium]|nr:hypothetical protein [Flavobacteriia bacterium]